MGMAFRSKIRLWPSVWPFLVSTILLDGNYWEGPKSTQVSDLVRAHGEGACFGEIRYCMGPCLSWIRSG
jgi:hypothetical protein